jgi:hypothetical protein
MSFCQWTKEEIVIDDRMARDGPNQLKCKDSTQVLLVYIVWLKYTVAASGTGLPLAKPKRLELLFKAY